MSVILPKFYLDSHIAKQVAIQGRRKGIDVIHCAEVGRQNLTDPEHLAYATLETRMMVTCDKEIEYGLLARWQTDGKQHAGLVLVSSEDCKGIRSIGAIVEELVFLQALIEVGAGTVGDDLYNRIWRV